MYRVQYHKWLAKKYKSCEEKKLLSKNIELVVIILLNYWEKRFNVQPKANIFIRMND